MTAFLTMTVLVITVKGGETVVLDQPPYLSNYLIEDDCQQPKVGSCSGDCHLLAVNLVNNKFHKEYLWSNCARMCSNKYTFDTFREYKARFECMSVCYNLYNQLSPHHDLARFCMK